MIVATGTPVNSALRKATKTVPIVSTVSSDPAGDGSAGSLARPGGNVTGLSNFAPEMSQKQVELLTAFVPKLSRLAVLVNPSNAEHSERLSEGTLLFCTSSDDTGGRGGMTTTPISLQDLRRRIYVTAKADKTKRFWGLHVHVVKRETLRTAYALAKRNNGAPGIDGVTFAAIEAAGIEAFLAQLRDELVARTYRPLRDRRVEIPKRGGKVRVLGIPAIRDRVVQGALKLMGLNLVGNIQEAIEAPREPVTVHAHSSTSRAGSRPRRRGRSARGAIG